MSQKLPSPAGRGWGRGSEAKPCLHFPAQETLTQPSPARGRAFQRRSVRPLGKSSVTSLKTPLPGGEGLGVGERGEASRPLPGAGNPHPTLPLSGESFSDLVAGDSEFFQDHGYDALGIGQHIIVPEANYPVAISLYRSRPHQVRRAVDMLSAIDLDRQPRRAAGKIDDEAANRQLPRKLNRQLLAAQARPQALFGFGRFPAQPLRNSREALFNYCSYALTQPSPAWGRAIMAV